MFLFNGDRYRSTARIGNTRCLFSTPYRRTAIRIPAGSKSPARHSPANPPTRSPLLWRAKVGAASGKRGLSAAAEALWRRRLATVRRARTRDWSRGLE